MLFPSGSWEWYEEEKDSFAFFDNKPHETTPTTLI